MKRAGIEDLEKLLQQMKFAYRRVGESSLLTGGRLRVPCYQYVLPMTVESSKYWISVRGYVHRGVPNGQRDSVQALLSQINSAIRVARFYFVEDCVVVQAEIRSEACSIVSFAEAFQTVARFARLYGLEVAVLATNPSVARGFDKVLAAARVGEIAGPVSGGFDMDDLDLSVNRLTG